MTQRQRFALRVFLAITVPIWLLPAGVFMLLYAIAGEALTAIESHRALRNRFL